MDKSKVLIVEDNKVTVELYNKFLFDEVFEKQTVTNGKEALKTYESWKPDIIILDIMIPEMSGYMVLKEIRLNFGDKKTAIIMSTSISRKESVMDCVNLGIQGYIVKPFKANEIPGKILESYGLVEPEKADAAKELYLKLAENSDVRKKEN